MFFYSSTYESVFESVVGKALHLSVSLIDYYPEQLPAKEVTLIWEVLYSFFI